MSKRTKQLLNENNALENCIQNNVFITYPIASIHLLLALGGIALLFILYKILDSKLDWPIFFHKNPQGRRRSDRLPCGFLFE